MKNDFKKGALYFFTGAFIILYFMYPESVSRAVSGALSLSGGVVIPSLFIFFVISDVFIKSGMCSDAGRLLSPVLSPLLHLSGGACTAFLLSLVAGYPAGGIGAVTLYKSGGAGRRECERLLMFSNNCGPAFFISAVGASMLGSAHTGAYLYAVHIISALCVGVLTGLIWPTKDAAGKTSPNAASLSAPALISEAIRSASLSMLYVCGAVVFFLSVIGLMRDCGLERLVCDVMGLFHVPPDLSRAALAAALELTAGSSMICASGADMRVMLSMLSAFLGFGGLSVHMQLLPHIREAGLRAGKYVMGKTLHGVTAAAITYFSAGRFAGVLPAFSPAGRYTPAIAFDGLSLALLFAGWALWALGRCFFKERERKTD